MKIILSIFVLGLVSSKTSHEGQESNMSVLELIKSNPQTKSFAELLSKPEYSDIASMLASKDESKTYTVMVPSNEAIDNLDNIKSLTNVPLKDILKYHIMPGVVTNSMVSALHFAPSTYSLKGRAQGMKLARSSEGNMQVSSGPLPPATVISHDLISTNGVVHVLDKVMIPPFSVQETLKRANLTHFLALTTHNDVISTMDKIAGGTVFAPTNDALESYASLRPELLTDDDAIYKLVKWHYAPSQVRFSTRVSAASPASLNTLSGPVRLYRNGNTLQVNSVKISRADLITRYGVLYILDGVVNPQADQELASVFGFKLKSIH